MIANAHCALSIISLPLPPALLALPARTALATQDPTQPIQDPLPQTHHPLCISLYRPFTPSQLIRWFTGSL